MRIALPGGGSVTCILSAQEGEADVFAGTVEGSDSPVDRCDLVITDGKIDGDIQLESGRYRIVPMEGGAHAVVELKPGAYPNEGDIPLPPLPNGAQRKSDRSIQDAPRCDVQPAKQLGPIRVLVLYTPAAKAQTSNIRAEIKLAMKQLNDAFRNTGGNFSIKAELADARPVSYVEADQTVKDGRQIAGMEVDLDRLSGNEPGYFNQVPALCDQSKADLVHLLVGYKETNPCGIGWMPPLDQIGADTREWAYSVSERGCAINNYSFIHELGHNLGLNHDRYVAGEVPATDYNFGYINLRKALRTVMAYNDECVANGIDCQRYPLFSTPALKIKGIPIGKPYGELQGAYNVEILCRTAPIVANYR
ncbi:MAG TPA: zinc-dependent metalloprotease family protein [Methyloceanibacter sp.]|nr:zinc-dependent metalloprotease family protein [Methyloceanibacter sp.]